MIIAAEIIILFGGIFLYQYFLIKNNQSAVSVVSQNTYVNKEYRFSIVLTDSWQGYSVVEKGWQGRVVDTGEQKYSGPLIIIKNPQTTAKQDYQDIPIMVFTHDVWKLVNGPNATVAVSAAPIGPAKIGENAKYVFATPPRWYGFTDAVGFDEAVNIVKTFKAF